MSEEPKEVSVAAFTDLIVSDASALGGGSVLALFGFLPAALTGVVASLTVGKKKYTEVEAEMCEVATTTEALEKGLVGEISHDPDFLNEFMAMAVLPKSTDEEKAARKTAMQNGSEPVVKVPHHVAETTARIFPPAKTVVERGDANAVTDDLAAVMAVRIVTIGAGLNVKISSASIEDEDSVVEYSARAATLEEQAITAERETLVLSELTREI